MRTPLDLQDSLVDEIDDLFADFQLGGVAGALNVYAQDLPETQTDDEDGSAPEPYCIVKLVDGSAGGKSNAVRVVLVFCTRDTSVTRQGHRDLLTMIFRVYERFAKNPYIGNFSFDIDAEGAFEWAIQDEDTYPYNIAACKLTFNCPAILKEDPLA